MNCIMKNALQGVNNQYKKECEIKNNSRLLFGKEKVQQMGRQRRNTGSASHSIQE